MKKLILLFFFSFCVFTIYSQYINDSVQTKKQTVHTNQNIEKKKSLINYFGVGANAGINYSMYNQNLLDKEFKYGYTYYTYSASLLTPIVNLTLTKSLNQTVHTFNEDYKLTKWDFNLAPLLNFKSREATMLYVYLNEFNWTKYETSFLTNRRMTLSAIISWDNDFYKTTFPGVQQVNTNSNRFYVGVGYLLKTFSNLGRDLHKFDRGKGLSQNFNSMFNAGYYDSYGDFSFLKFILPAPLADIGYQHNRIVIGNNNQITKENGLFIRLGIGYVRNIMIGNHILIIPNINWIFFDKLANENYEGILKEKSFNASLKVQIYL